MLILVIIIILRDVMKYIEHCPECKSKKVVVTSVLYGKLLTATCLDCGWSTESEEFHMLSSKLDRSLKNFARDDYLKTKK